MCVMNSWFDFQGGPAERPSRLLSGKDRPPSMCTKVHSHQGRAQVRIDLQVHSTTRGSVVSLQPLEYHP